MNWNDALAIETSFIERDLGDEIVLMSQDGQEIHSFEDTAYWIWKRMKEGLTPEDIISQLTKEYKVDDKTARQDFLTFIDELKNKRILK